VGFNRHQRPRSGSSNQETKESDPSSGFCSNTVSSSVETESSCRVEDKHVQSDRNERREDKKDTNRPVVGQSGERLVNLDQLLYDAETPSPHFTTCRL
jgi:hypothetical protein